VVLNIDGVPATRGARARALRREGFAVASAASVTEAIGLPVKRSPHVIVLSCGGGEASVEQLIRPIKSSPLLADVPLALVGQTLDDVRHVAFDVVAGVDALVIESVGGDAMSSAIRRLLSPR
jgi:DNA-binding response OmpR family regulator